MRIRRVCLVVLPFAIASTPAAALAQNAPPCRSTVSGDVRMHTLTSKILGNTRTIRVLVPPGYGAPENAAVRYPVLYMLDGQNLFDACLSAVSQAEWNVDETVYRLVREKKIRPLIVVGVDHTGKERGHEYLPYRDFIQEANSREPIGKQFPDFLTNEVMPLVDRAYRTLQGHANTGVGGSSYGAIAALYSMLAKPNHFGFGLIESPTFWIGMGQLVRDTSPLTAWPVRIFFALGGREIGEPTFDTKSLALFRQVEANFRAAGYDDKSIKVVFDVDARHTEAAWALRLPGALTFLFAR